jgi:tetratricopeptide (TPR) repeat protein
MLKPLLEGTSKLLAGRWEVPLAITAVAVGAVGLYSLLPAPPAIDLDAVLADVRVLEKSGDRLAAIDAVANLLDVERDEPLGRDAQAVLHNRLAELVYELELAAPDHNTANVEMILEHTRRAAELGRALDVEDRLRSAYAQHWLDHEDVALDQFRRLLREDLTDAQRRGVIRELVTILQRRPEARLERRKMLDTLLADEAIPAAELWWALRRTIEDALDEGDSGRARALLAQHGDRLRTSDLKGYLEFLDACIMLHEGRPEAAAPIVRWVDDWLGSAPRVAGELDRYGHLPGLNRWLMGRVHLLEDRPQDALVAFEDALSYEPQPDLRIAASVGRGLALGALRRHAAALETFRDAVAALTRAPNFRRQAIAEFQDALIALFEAQEKLGEHAHALAYLELAAELTPADDTARRLELYERLGRGYRRAAQAADDEDTARAYHAQAGAALEQASKLIEFDEPRLATLVWDASQEYDQGGRIGAVRRLLTQFVDQRSDHPNLPEAMLQLGRAHEAFGELEEALTWYRRVLREYPRLAEASRAKLLSAETLLALGPEHYHDAEGLLAELLSSGEVTPEARVYRAALLRLCDLLYFEGRFAEAISRLEDFEALYPNATERRRAQFMRANAYRRSAVQLREDPPADAPPGQAAQASRARFRAAAALYAELLAELETVAAPDEAERLYARLALFYRADCLFELNEPQTLRVALAAYQNAAARYDGEPAALTAQVQIANIFLRLGEPAEAARAMERASWLLRSIPADAYDEFDGGRQEDWDRFVAVVLSSGLFKDVFGARP